MSPVLTVHLAATACMTGLIWFVQIVHYPLMRLVAGPAFVEYERSHTLRTTWVVGPLMLVEAAAAAWLVAWLAGSGGLQTRDGVLAVMGAGLLMLIWASTFLVQVPLHGRLAGGFDEGVWRRLVATNWVRTVLWSARTALAGIIVITAARGD